MGVQYQRGQTETWRTIIPEARADIHEPTVPAGTALFEVAGSYQTGQGVVLSGRVKAGTLRKGMCARVLGRKAKILDLSVGLKPVKTAEAGQQVSILLERAAGSFIRHGDTLGFAAETKAKK